MSGTITEPRDCATCGRPLAITAATQMGDDGSYQFIHYCREHAPHLHCRIDYDTSALLLALEAARRERDSYKYPHDFGLPSSREPGSTCALCGAIYAAPDGKGTPCAEMQRIWQDSRPRE